MKKTLRIAASKKNRRLALAALGILVSCLVPASLHAAARTWSGNTDDVMGTSTNWNAAPVTGDSFVFSSTNTSGDFNLNNNLTSGSFSLAGITFNAGSPSYILGDGSSTSGSVGNTFILGGNVANNSTNLQTILNPFSMTTTRTFTGNLTLGGNISGTGGALTYNSAGNTLTLNGTNSYTGATTLSAGNIVVGNKQAFGSGTVAFNGVAVSANTDLSGANAIANNFSLGGTNTFTGTNNIQLSGSLASTPSRTVTNNISTGSLIFSNAAINIGSATTTSATLTFNGSGNTTISGNLLNNVTGAGTSNVTYVGTGKLTLSGTNTYTGATTLNSGTLVLDFGGASAPASNIIPSTSTLGLGSSTFLTPVLGAGKQTLQVLGKADTANSQSNPWTLTAGSTYFDLSTSGTGTLTYNIASLNRSSSGAIVNITKTSGVTITTGQANGSNGLFGSGSVILDKTDFTTNSGGNVVAYTGYTASTGTTLSGVADVVGNVTLASGTTTLSAMRFNNTNGVAGPITVTLASDNVFLNPGNQGQGMILVTPTAGSFLTKITGGLIGSNVVNRDTVIVQNNTAGDLQIDSRITQFSGDTSSNSFTKSGAGKLILTSNNTYGAGASTIINEGTLVVAGDVTASSSQSATLSSSSTTVTGLDTTGLFIGQRVLGTGFGTTRGGYITGITAGTGTSGSITVNAAPSVSGTQTLTFSASGGLGLGTGATAVNVGAGATLQIGNGGSTGGLVDNQGITNNGSVVFNKTTALSMATNPIQGVGSVTQSGSGTTTLGGTNTYTGSTSVGNGTLLVSSTGSLTGTSGVSVTGGTFRYDGTTALNRNVTVNGGKFSYNSSNNYAGTLTFTSGTIGGSNISNLNLSIGTGQTMSPGNSTGTMTAGATTWATGGTFLFELNDTTGTAGSTSLGWDLLNAASLNITAGTGEFTIQIASLDNLQAAGNALNFDGSSNYTWLFVDAGATITGFNAAKFLFNDSAFLNSTPGMFSISQGSGVDDDKLYLNYTGVIPEPSTYAMLVGGLGLLAFLRRRSKA